MLTKAGFDTNNAFYCVSMIESIMKTIIIIIWRSFYKTWIVIKFLLIKNNCCEIVLLNISFLC